MQKAKKCTERIMTMESQVITIKATMEMAMMTRVTMAIERIFLCLKRND